MSLSGSKREVTGRWRDFRPYLNIRHLAALIRWELRAKSSHSARLLVIAAALHPRDLEHPVDHDFGESEVPGGISQPPDFRLAKIGLHVGTLEQHFGKAFIAHRRIMDDCIEDVVGLVAVP
jgi:hypothetical protein